MSDHPESGPPARRHADDQAREVEDLRRELAASRKREHELQESMERYQRESAERRIFKAVAQNSGDFIALCTPLMGTIFLNEAARRMVGLPSTEEIVHTNILDYFWPEDRAIIEARAMPAVRAKQSWSGEVRLRNFKTGRPILTQWTAFPIEDETGEIIAFASVSPKIEQLRKAQAALEESEAALRVVFDSTYDGIIVHGSDGEILDFNQTARQMYGIGNGSPEGLRVADLSAPSMPLHSLTERWTKTLGGSPQLFEWKAARVDNAEEFDVEVYLRRVRLRGRDLILANVRDIKERKRAEQALQQSEATYRAIGESIPYGIWMTDPQGGVIYLSDSFLELTGMPLEEAQAFGWIARLPLEDVDRTLSDWRSCLQTDCFWDYEHRIRAVDGSYRTILSRGLPIRDESGEVQRWAGINLDITNLKRTEASLRRANEELQRFATVASHDLKAPLRAVHGLSSWIEEEVAEHLSEEGRQRMRLLRERVEQMDNLINAILDYSRAGTEVADIEEVNTAELVTEVTKMHGAPEGFTVSAAPDLPRLETDRLHLQQVFSHLIGNAIEHHDRPDGNVWISARDVGDCYEFSVADDGPGIPPGHRDHLFEVFRGEPAQATGVGIGLAIVRRVVEGLGGKVKLESAPGLGATFRFTWPKVIRRDDLRQENGG